MIRQETALKSSQFNNVKKFHITIHAIQKFCERSGKSFCIDNLEEYKKEIQERIKNAEDVGDIVYVRRKKRGKKSKKFFQKIFCSAGLVFVVTDKGIVKTVLAKDEVEEVLYKKGHKRI